MLYYMIFPYLCVDLSLSEQVKHLSATAHLALALYKMARKDFIPTNLYIDLIIMIKNVLFCIAKAKVDDPNEGILDYSTGHRQTGRALWDSSNNGWE
jgi:hypothetical protein